MDELKALLEKVKGVVAEAEVNLTKYVEKGNKSAAGRVRKDMQALKKIAQEIRVTIMTKIKEGKEKYKETLEEQVRRLLNERNEIMANQAELLNRFIDLQKEVDNKIENKFSIESDKVDKRITEYKETMDSHYKKIAGTISNLQIDTLKSVVKENGRKLDEALIDIAGLEQNKMNKPFK